MGMLEHMNEALSFIEENLFLKEGWRKKASSIIILAQPQRGRFLITSIT